MKGNESDTWSENECNTHNYRGKVGRLRHQGERQKVQEKRRSFGVDTSLKNN
jgi:hypothetical protein